MTSISSSISSQSSWEGPLQFLDLSERCRSEHEVSLPAGRCRPCFRLDNLLSESECRQIVARVAELHDTSVPVSLEPGVRSQISVRYIALQQLVWERIKHLIPQELDGGTVVGLQEEWRHGMYHTGQSVFPHMDFEHVDREDELICSRMSLTIYLNDDFTGGDTAFVKRPIGFDGSHGGIYYRSVPRTGSAVLFYQNVPEYYHTAEVVESGCKLIMRSDVMYRFKDKESVRIKTTVMI